MIYVYSALIGYLLGSINSSVVLSKIKGRDVRKQGSGNAGATNTLRVFGKSAAVIVVLGDLAKTVIAIYLVKILFNSELCNYIAAICAVLGHNFPVYFKFKGGKGVLSSLAAIVVISPIFGVSALFVAIIIIAVTRYVSLGSMVGAIAFVGISVVFGETMLFKLFSVIIALLIIVMHRQNIVRLLNKTERRLGEKSE